MLEYKGLEHFVPGFPKLCELYLVDWHHHVCETLLVPLKVARPVMKVYVNVNPTNQLRYDLLCMGI